MQISEKAAYVKGLIEGLELDPKDKQTKVFKLIADLLGDMAQEIKDLEQCYDDVCDQLDGVSEDLAGVEDIIYDEDYDNGSISFGSDGLNDEYSYEVTCPTCGNIEYLSEDSLNEGSITCSECGEVLEFDYSEDELDASDDDAEDDIKE